MEPADHQDTPVVVDNSDTYLPTAADQGNVSSTMSQPKETEGALLNHDEEGVEPAAENEQSSICSTCTAMLGVILPAGGMLFSILSIASTSIGAGILGLPDAFKNTGTVMSFFYLVVITAETVYSMWVLVTLADRTGLHSYEQLTEALLHKNALYFVAVIRWIYCVGAMVSYIVTVGNLLVPIMEDSNASDFLQGNVGIKLIQAGLWLAGCAGNALCALTEGPAYVSVCVIGVPKVSTRNPRRNYKAKGMALICDLWQEGTNYILAAIMWCAIRFYCCGGGRLFLFLQRSFSLLWLLFRPPISCIAATSKFKSGGKEDDNCLPSIPMQNTQKKNVENNKCNPLHHLSISIPVLCTSIHCVITPSSMNSFLWHQSDIVVFLSTPCSHLLLLLSLCPVPTSTPDASASPSRGVFDDGHTPPVPVGTLKDRRESEGFKKERKSKQKSYAAHKPPAKHTLLQGRDWETVMRHSTHTYIHIHAPLFPHALAYRRFTIRIHYVMWHCLAIHLYNHTTTVKTYYVFRAVKNLPHPIPVCAFVSGTKRLKYDFFGAPLPRSHSFSTTIALSSNWKDRSDVPCGPLLERRQYVVFLYLINRVYFFFLSHYFIIEARKRKYCITLIHIYIYIYIGVPPTVMSVPNPFQYLLGVEITIAMLLPVAIGIFVSGALAFVVAQRRTLLVSAQQRATDDLVKLCKEKGDKYWHLPAADVRRCVQAGADVSTTSPFLRQPILCQLVHLGLVDCLKACMETGKPINFTLQDAYGNNAFMCAVVANLPRSRMIYFFIIKKGEEGRKSTHSWPFVFDLLRRRSVEKTMEERNKRAATLPRTFAPLHPRPPDRLFLVSSQKAAPPPSRMASNEKPHDAVHIKTVDNNVTMHIYTYRHIYRHISIHISIMFYYYYPAVDQYNPLLRGKDGGDKSSSR
eukprot:gene2117-1293_t